MRIYVGNLNFRTREETIREVFSQFGAVRDVHVVTDRETGRPRGFAFVEMENSEEGNAAIDALNETELEGRNLTVNEAHPRPERR